jgi:hypothetical protein
MKKNITNTEDTCWRDCIGCILGIEPVGVPDFIKRYKESYMDRTREWLEDKYNKGIVYVPSSEFMETGELKYNGSVGPWGYSIGMMKMLSSEEGHVVICKNGAVVWDNGEDRHEEYDVLVGYFIIYDLDAKGVMMRRGKKKGL